MEENQPPVHTKLNLPVVDLTDDASTINFTQNLMANLIQSMAPQGIVPQDPEYLKIMIKAGSEMSKVAMGRMKIKSEEKIADTQAQAAGVIADMLMQHHGAISGLGADTTHRDPPPPMGAEFSRPDMVPGAMEISPGHQSVASFMQANRPLLGNTGETPTSVLTPVVPA